jgi:triosephosphate isomerase
MSLFGPLAQARPRSPEQAQAVHAILARAAGQGHACKAADFCALLYGGSVKSDNAVELFSQPDINGGLIGGASLKASDFRGHCSRSLT